MLDIEQLPRQVELVGECTSSGCVEFAAKLRSAVADRKYQVGASIMEMPVSLLDWRAEHRTARKRADRAHRIGYRFDKVDYSLYPDDIHEINTSLPERQGRPMSDGYQHRIERSALPEFPCLAHRTITFGVFEGYALRAYLTLHRSGELAMVSMILGHGDHLENGIMFQLFQGMISDQAGSGGIVYYNRHDSGTEGLVWFKERLGLYEASVEWIL